MRNLECSLHLFWGCLFSLGVWFRLSSWKGYEALNLTRWRSTKTTTKLTQHIIENTAAGNKKAIKSIIIMAAWEIWQERNNNIFRGKSSLEGDIITTIRHAPDLKRSAEGTCVEQPFGDLF